MPQGRYRSRYGELRTIGTNDTDLATARFGEALVSCWTCEKDRQWGTFGRHQQCAAIMHFQMQALPGSDDCRVSHFELDLMFTPTTEGRIIRPSTRFRSGDSGLPNEQADLCLIGPPAPTCVSHDAAVGTQDANYWKFWSSRISDSTTGQAFTARWMWQADNVQELEGRILHGGVAVRHPGKPFLITCHVRGRVAKPNGIRLKFSNQHHEPRPWKLCPEMCDQDLQDHIEKLDLNIQRLNMPRGITQSPYAGQDQSQVDPHPPIYGFNLIGGRARVLMGNAAGDPAQSLFQPEPL